MESKFNPRPIPARPCAVPASRGTFGCPSDGTSPTIVQVLSTFSPSGCVAVCNLRDLSLFGIPCTSKGGLLFKHGSTFCRLTPASDLTSIGMPTAWVSAVKPKDAMSSRSHPHAVVLTLKQSRLLTCLDLRCWTSSAKGRGQEGSKGGHPPGETKRPLPQCLASEPRWMAGADPSSPPCPPPRCHLHANPRSRPSVNGKPRQRRRTRARSGDDR